MTNAQGPISPIVYLMEESPLASRPGKSSYTPVLSDESLEGGHTPESVVICYGDSGLRGQSVFLVQNWKPDNSAFVWAIKAKIEGTYSNLDLEEEYAPMVDDLETEDDSEYGQPETVGAQPVVEAIISSVQDEKPPTKKKRRTKAEIEAQKQVEVAEKAQAEQEVEYETQESDEPMFRPNAFRTLARLQHFHGVEAVNVAMSILETCAESSEASLAEVYSAWTEIQFDQA